MSISVDNKKLQLNFDSNHKFNMADADIITPPTSDQCLWEVTIDLAWLEGPSVTMWLLLLLKPQPNGDALIYFISQSVSLILSYWESNLRKLQESLGKTNKKPPKKKHSIQSHDHGSSRQRSIQNMIPVPIRVSHIHTRSLTLTSKSELFTCGRRKWKCSVEDYEYGAGMQEGILHLGAGILLLIQVAWAHHHRNKVN